MKYTWLLRIMHYLAEIGHDKMNYTIIPEKYFGHENLLDLVKLVQRSVFIKTISEGKF